MNYEKLFEVELTYLKSDRIKKACLEMTKLLPDYFYEVPASSTGKYHPSYSLGDGGLLRHSKAAMRIGYELLQDPSIGDKYTDDEKDLMLMALLIHDGLKSGNPKEKYTRFDHPILMGDFVLENIDKTKLTKLEATMISDNIKSHMGEWNTNPYSQVVLPKPKNKYQKMVHMCDLLASRKFINVNFNNNRIEE
jgi:hypothetical protein